MIDLGTVRPGATIRIPFSTFDKDDGSAITMTNFAVADILVYKDGSTTERASTAGFTATTDFDAKTGKHLIVIDLADNTTSGFYTAGSEYLVALDAVTVDAVTTGGWVARFRIGYPCALLDTTIATLSSQTSFTLTTGPSEDDAINGLWAVIHDAASAVQMSEVLVSDYVGSTRTVTLAAGATFTVAAGDNFSLMGMAPLQPATLGRLLAVGAAGQADANVTQFGGTNLTATGGRPEVNTSHIAGSAVSTSSAQIGVNVVNAGGTAWGSGAITAGSIAADAITAAKIADGAIDAATFATGAITASAIAADAITDAKVAADVTIASVTGSVGSVTGNVGGNVTGSVGSLAAQAKADVNAEVLDVLTTDTFTEPGAVPAATSTIKDKINWLFALARNKMTQTSTTSTLRNDADSGNIGTSTVSDDGTTATRNEWS